MPSHAHRRKTPCAGDYGHQLKDEHCRHRPKTRRQKLTHDHHDHRDHRDRCDHRDHHAHQHGDGGRQSKSTHHPHHHHHSHKDPLPHEPSHRAHAAHHKGRPRPPATRPAPLRHNAAHPRAAAANATAPTRPRGYPKPLGHGKGFPVLSTRRYVREQSTAFHILMPQDKKGPFEVCDGLGKPFFLLHRPHPHPQHQHQHQHSSRLRHCASPGTTTLYDVSPSRTHSDGSAHAHAPLLRARHHVLTARRTVVVTQGNTDVPLLQMSKVSMVNVPKVVNGHLRSSSPTRHRRHHHSHGHTTPRRRRGGDARNGDVGGTATTAYSKSSMMRSSEKPHLVITEERHRHARRRSYIVRDGRSNEVACIERYRVASSAHKKKHHAYKLFVSAGYDCALFVMVSVLLLQMWDN